MLKHVRDIEENEYFRLKDGHYFVKTRDSGWFFKKNARRVTRLGTKLEKVYVDPDTLGEIFVLRDRLVKRDYVSEPNFSFLLTMPANEESIIYEHK